MPAKNAKTPRPSRADRAAAASAKATAERLSRVVERKRKVSISRHATAVEALSAYKTSPAEPIAAKYVTAAGVRERGVLVAEGDSWFDYCGSDVLKELDDLGFDIEEKAHRGDTIEEMAYSEQQLDDLKRLLQKVIRDRKRLRAILISGGGNDVAGNEFAQLLNHALSSQPGLNDDIVRGVIDVRVRDAYLTILYAVTAVCQSTLGRVVPIVIHGYGRPRPDGRGVGGGWGKVIDLPGPWLRPGFHAKGFLSESANTETIGLLIDRMNNMLQRVAAMPDLSHVRYVDVRSLLDNSATGYKESWANELHPTETGFTRVALAIANAVELL